MGSGGFSSPFSAQCYHFFAFLSWHGLKYFLLLRKLDDKVISPWGLKLMTLQTVYKGVDPRGAVTGRIGWWERSFSCRSTRTSKPVYFRKITRPYLLKERPMKNTNLERTSVRHRRIRKPKTTCGKKGKYARKCWNQLWCRQLGGRGTQKLAAKSLQTNITLEIQQIK